MRFEDLSVGKLRVNDGRKPVKATEVAEIGAILDFSTTVDLASVAAATTAEQNVTVSGLKSGDRVLNLEFGSALDAGLGVVGYRVSADDTLTLRMVNTTAGAINEAAGLSLKVLVARLR